MNVPLMIVVSIFALTLMYIILIKRKKIKDENKNYIPDSVDEKIKQTKVRIARVKEETMDVVKSVKEVVKQAKDANTTIYTGGGNRKGRKKKINK